MEENTYKKIVKYLYNYKEFDTIINEIKDSIYGKTNCSITTWNKRKNTMENQIIAVMDNKKIKTIKEWQVFIKETLAFFRRKYPKYYYFLKLKYLENNTEKQIEEKLKLDLKKQKVIDMKLRNFIYKNALKKNLKEIWR